MKLLVPVKGSIQNPTFAPDGRTYMFTRFRNGYSIGAADIYIADLRDRERLNLVTGNEKSPELSGKCNWNAPGFRSSWSTKGWIGFSTDVKGLPWPHMIRPNGDKLTELPGYDGHSNGGPPSFSPSADEFVFQRTTTDGKNQIVASMSWVPEGGAYNRVIGEGRSPSWSPNGKLIAWVLNGRIRVHDVDSGDTRDVTKDGREFSAPSWHPDSDKLLAGGENALYEITVTGHAPKPVFPVEHPRTYWVANGSWSPEVIGATGGTRRRLICEGSDRDNPDGGPGTWIEVT